MKPGKPQRPIEEYYTIIDRGYKTPCWIWIGTALQRKGYGQITRNKKTYKASRFVYECFGGTIPKGFTLDHLCRNRDCVNPQHLEPVTNFENVTRGDSAKLTTELVTEIKKDLKTAMSQEDIAEKYDISQPTVSNIHNGRSWRDAN